MQIEHYSLGQPCWPELITTDALAAKAFYHALFGWTWSDMPLGENASGVMQYYSMWQIAGDDVGAMYEMPEPQKAGGMPPVWSLYFAVPDVAAAIARVQAADGNLVTGPNVVGDAGVMALFQDPEGANFAVWQANQHIGAKRGNEPSTLCWAELACRHPLAAAQFYQQVFAWHSHTSSIDGMPYTEFQIDGQSVAGMIAMDSEWGDMPANWLPYFAVADCDASATLATQHGGKICVPPTDIPDVGRFAVINDPQGGVFAIVALG